MADALASLALLWEGLAKIPMKPLILLKLEQPIYKYLRIAEIKAYNKPWFYDIQQYLTKRVYLENATKKDKAVIQ